MEFQIAALCPAQTTSIENEKFSSKIKALYAADFSSLHERFNVLANVNLVDDLRTGVDGIINDVVASEGECGVLYLAALSSEVYLQTNWTGPEIKETLPFGANEKSYISDFGKVIRNDMLVNGEEVYEGMKGITYLWLANYLIKHCSNLCSTPIWQGRIAFLWQRSLADATDHGAGHSPTLLKQSLENLLEYDLSWLPTDGQAAVELEIAQRILWYGRSTTIFSPLFEKVCEKINFNFFLTGEHGIRRQYQTFHIAQLVVRTNKNAGEALETESCTAQEKGDSTEKVCEEDAAGKDKENVDDENKRPVVKKLVEMDEETDIFETPKLDQDNNEKALNALEQCVLLAKCQHLWTTNSTFDEMMLEEINALAGRILVTREAEIDGMWTSNWLVFSCGLWFRCKTEYHRIKTRERAVFQLQELVRQFEDDVCTAGHRMQYAYQTNYPPIHYMQWELGMRMMKMGMLLTAFAHFETLRMWPEAVDCLIVAEREEQALDLVKSLLKENETARLWCALGDLEENPAHYEKAWEISNHSSGRAMRSLGRYFFNKETYDRCIECYTLAVELNPLHTKVWFNIGCAQLRLLKYEDASKSFQQCVILDVDNGQAWGNLAACFSNLDRWDDAKRTIEQAVKWSRGYRMWESFLGIHLHLRDVPGCTKALENLVDLDGSKMLDLNMIRFVVNNCSHMDEKIKKRITALCEKLTAKRSEPTTWELYGDMLAQNEQWAELWNCRLNQLRAVQKKMFDDDVHAHAFLDSLKFLDETIESLAKLVKSEREGSGLVGLVMTIKNIHKKMGICLKQWNYQENAEAVAIEAKIKSIYDELNAISKERNAIKEETTE